MEQGQLDFQSDGPESGYSRWVIARHSAAEEAARKLNLPLGRLVEVWLRGGVRLRGELRLKDDILFVEEDRVRTLTLVVDKTEFTYAEIDSCLRLD
jgi:hypothetical protein